MKRSLKLIGLLAVLTMTLTACLPFGGSGGSGGGGNGGGGGGGIQVVARGAGELAGPGEEVTLEVIGENITTVEWQLSDKSLGQLTPSSDDPPTKAVFKANAGVLGKVTISVSTNRGSGIVEFLAGEVIAAGARAWDFVAEDDQGRGGVESPEDRGYGPDTVISHWNYAGHWLEWELDVPETGEYALVLRYATNKDPHLTKREIRIDGEIAAPTLSFRNTGGFAKGDMSQWDTAVFRGLEVEKGTRTIRLTHAGDEPDTSHGLNLAYLALVKLGDVEINDALLVEIEKAIGVERDATYW